MSGLYKEQIGSGRRIVAEDEMTELVGSGENPGLHQEWDGKSKEGTEKRIGTV